MQSTYNYMSARELAAAHGCFHCGLPLPSRSFPVIVETVERQTCCRGCQAVAQTIAESGLASYYRTRSALPAPPDDADELLKKLGVYDLAEVQRGFVRELDAARPEKEAALLLEGVSCAACVWLIERRLAQLAGVRGVTINYAARRARVRWDAERIRLSAILRAIRALGFEARPYDAARSEAALRIERKSMLTRLAIAGLGMMQVMMYALPAYVADGAMTPDIEQLMRLASLVLTAPVVFWSAWPFHSAAWREIRARRVGMEVPVAAGVLIAFIASAWSTWHGAGEVYFDSISMFVFLLLGARYLEMSARAKAAAAQERLAGIAPAVAERLDRFPDARRHEQVPAARLQPGDFVLVRPGACVPADGIVAEGSSAVDESLLTGEARAVPKDPGAGVTGGSMNTRSPFVMRVERVGAASVLAGVVRLIDRAQGETPRVALAADRAARWFSAGALVLALAAASAWLVFDPARALWIGIAVLFVACPCALSLATPAALAATTGSLLRSGVLVTRGHALETLARATHYVFDKTGTLTDGAMRLIGVIPLGAHDRANALKLAAALERSSEHAIAHAVCDAVPSGESRATVGALANIPGCGMEGIVEGRRLRIGSLEFVREMHALPLPPELAFVSDEVSVVALGDARGWIALLTFGDCPRRDARRLIAELKAAGKSVYLLSGDGTRHVRQLAHDLGIESFRGEARPEDKVAFVRELQREGAVVAMVGDGVNDAPVLAQAQVSIAMATGTELAQSNADVVLMGSRLSPLGATVSQAARTLRIIRQNLIWAAVYNAVALPLAAAGLVTPLAAALGMSLSSLAVVLNALRLAGGGEGVAAWPGAKAARAFEAGVIEAKPRT